MRKFIMAFMLFVTTQTAAQTKLSDCISISSLTGKCLATSSGTVLDSAGSVSITSVVLEPKTSHLVEYTGVMLHHDHLTAEDCAALKAQIESKTTEHAECFQ